MCDIFNIFPSYINDFFLNIVYKFFGYSWDKIGTMGQKGRLKSKVLFLNITLIFWTKYFPFKH